ncbi:cytochrome c [uncultured Jannaschia sp.]|uniref:c-type cytochrome n=1 Tax=uncultured Jannaschia sp. TaxID=293347 RepID=UPI00263378B1|nr:cytochrome c [uncultured Jannaschia sp.]
MKLFALALGGVFLAGPLAAQAGDPEAGRALAGQCRTCHGLDGVAQIPVAPNIGGEPAPYLARQLEAFRSGARVNEMMSVVAASLSDAQIADLAAWYASHRPVASLSADPSDAPELCSACHGADGISVIEDAPNLAGENSIYTETQLKAFRSGRRESEVMGPIAAELSDADIRAVSDWYAATTLEIVSP